MTFLLLLGTILFSLFMMLCFENMRAFQTGNKKRDIAYAVLLVFAVAVTLFALHWAEIDIGDDPVPPIIILPMALVLGFQLKSVIKGVVVGLFSILAAISWESMVILFFQLFGYEEIPSQWFLFAFLGTIACMVTVVFLLKRFLKKRIDMNIFNSRGIYLVTAVSGIMLLIINISQIGGDLEAAREIVYVLFFISSMVLIGIVLRYVYRETGLRAEMLIAEASKKYIQDLEESYTALRTIKHDYVNIMTSFKLYIDKGDMAGLTRYYYDEFSEMNQELLRQDQWVKSLHNVRISEIKSVLLYKCSLAVERRLYPAIEAVEPIDSLGVSTAIVCQILGILLDNAIEAAEETAEKTLSIAMIKNPDSKTFVIQNAWFPQEIALGKLFELGFSTKGQGRGVGLHTLRGYTDKIKGLLLETEFDDKAFTQILTVKDGSP